MKFLDKFIIRTSYLDDTRAVIFPQIQTISNGLIDLNHKKIIFLLLIGIALQPKLSMNLYNQTWDSDDLDPERPTRNMNKLLPLSNTTRRIKPN